MLKSGILRDGDGQRHGFFTRAGGVSDGLYASLNCGLGSRDRTARVIENRRRACLALNAAPAALATPYQVHGTNVLTLETPFAQGVRPEADGLVTRHPGIVLGILTADCAPILLADRETGVIGAAHAGWRGALAGIAEATVAAMVALGARRERIAAAIGPTIGFDSYEVGPEFPAPFLEQDRRCDRFFKPSARARHWLFDLIGYVESRLAKAGLDAVEALGHDTRTDAERFFSYRRATLAGEPDYGRQLSAIVLAD